MAYFTKRLGIGALLVLSAVGCGPEFDPASNLSTLRILAIKKDDPYVRVTAPTDASPSGDSYQPDNVVSLTLGLEDGRPKSDRLGDLQKLWFAGCNNPFGDSYFSCLVSVWITFKAYDGLKPNLQDEPYKSEGWGLADADPADLLAFVEEQFPTLLDASQDGAGASSDEERQQLLDQVLALRIGVGETFNYTVPEWLIERHAPPADPDLPRYGLTQVYSAVCDGTIALSDEWQGELDPMTVLTDATRGFPLTCIDPATKEQRGPDNFMVAYSNIYAYEELTNKNPVISGVELDGDAVDASALCIGASCPVGEDACDNPKAPRVARCTKSRAADCPTIALLPIIEEAENSEVDLLATNAGSGGGNLLEQMWLRYYSDRGEIVKETKRLQDATAGWFTDHGTDWRIPRKPGTARLWSVVYDNRGGVDWVRTSVCVEDSD